MKTFSATHLNKHAQEVFAAAKDDGGAMIKHDHFKSGRFIITWEKSYAGPDIDPAIAKLPLHPASDQ